MKMVVFAHTPPPHHGQSFMVKMVLDGLGGDVRETGEGGKAKIACYHVDARFSDSIGQIGHASASKAVRLVRYVCQAIQCRIRHGARVLFYVPASGVRSAVYRDWAVMVMARLFFKHRVYYWQAAGLSEWLEKGAKPWERVLTRILLSGPTLSIVLGEYVRSDAEYFKSRRTEVIYNAVPDPVPDFAMRMLPRRKAMALERHGVFRLLYLSLCMREKGLFDVLEAVSKVNARLASDGTGIRVRFTVAGSFYSEAEQAEFEVRIAQRDLNGGGPLEDGGQVVEYVGFVKGADKTKLFEGSNAFAFPSYYPMEGHPVSLVEAMAHGLPALVSNWRALPELFPADYPYFVEPRRPDILAEKLHALIFSEYSPVGRDRYEQAFKPERFIRRMEVVLQRVEED